jgi:hypothetical protein
VASSLQQIYQKVFGQQRCGLRELYRLLIWIAGLGLTVIFDTVAGRPVRNAADGAVLAVLVTFAIWTPFFWRSMHFLLACRVRWRRLLPSSIASGAFFAGLGVFSMFCFSSTIISDSKTYGTIGAVLSIMTWFIAHRGGDHPGSCGRCCVGGPEKLNCHSRCVRMTDLRADFSPSSGRRVRHCRIHCRRHGGASDAG